MPLLGGRGGAGGGAPPPPPPAGAARDAVAVKPTGGGDSFTARIKAAQAAKAGSR